MDPRRLLTALALALALATALVAAADGRERGGGPARLASRVESGHEAAPRLLGGERCAELAGESVPARAAPARDAVATWDRPQPDRAGEATLAGRVGTGPARLEVVAGSNLGLAIESDPDGSFRRTGLHPGLQVVRVESRELGTLERVVRLGSTLESTLTLEPCAAAALAGRVLDRAGNPLPGARVVLDGRATTTGLDGSFTAARAAAGQPLLRVEADGYARAAALLPDGEPRRALEVVLDEEARLDVECPGLGTAGAIDLVVVPLDAPRPVHGAHATLTPWRTPEERLSRPGERRTVTGLAPGRVRVVALHSDGALAAVETRLAAGRTATVALAFEREVRRAGRVTRGGAPVAGARVVLRVPRAVAAQQRMLGIDAALAARWPLDVLAPFRGRHAGTDADGRFAIPLVAAARERVLHVEVGGTRLASRAVGNGPGMALELRLGP